MHKTHFKRARKTQIMLDLKEFGGHPMNRNIKVLTENIPREAWRMASFPFSAAPNPVLSQRESDCPPGQQGSGGLLSEKGQSAISFTSGLLDTQQKISKYFMYEHQGEEKKR